MPDTNETNMNRYLVQTSENCPSMLHQEDFYRSAADCSDPLTTLSLLSDCQKLNVALL